MGIHRQFFGECDLQLMTDLLVSIRSPDQMAEYPSPTDLREVLSLTEIQENTRLWFDADGQCVGFAFVDNYHNLRFEYDPEEVNPDIELEIVDWGEQCIRRVIKKYAEPLMLDVSCRDDDRARIAFFERYGFVMQEVHSLHMARSLTGPIARMKLPAGFKIRRVTGEQEVPALVALHRSAFSTDHMTIEERLAMMRVQEYDPDLDLVITEPEGQLAGYCMCSISQEENKRTGSQEGSIDTIVMHPDFQRRGLAQTLLLTGLRRLKRRGLDTALLSTSSGNIPMQRTAAAVGFRKMTTTLWFAKSVK